MYISVLKLSLEASARLRALRASQGFSELRAFEATVPLCLRGHCALDMAARACLRGHCARKRLIRARFEATQTLKFIAKHKELISVYEHRDF